MCYSSSTATLTTKHLFGWRSLSAKVLALGILAILLSLSFACGTSGATPIPNSTSISDETERSSDQQQSTVSAIFTTQPEAPLTDAVGIYLSATLDQDSSLFRNPTGGSILLESSTNGVVLVNMESGSASLVTTNNSPGFARNKLVPVTSEDMLYIVTEYSSGGVYYDEYDPMTRSITGTAGRKLPDDTSQYAFSGGTAYYVNRIERLGGPRIRRLVQYGLTEMTLFS